MLATWAAFGSCGQDDGGEGPEPTAPASASATATASPEGSDPLLPDLVPGAVSDLSVLAAPNGVRFLFFSTSLSNAGAGPLRLVATRDEDTWEVQEVTSTAEGGSDSAPIEAKLLLGIDGTSRWVFADFVRYRLTSLDADGPLLTPPATQIGACLDAEGTCGDAESGNIEMSLEPGEGVNLPWYDPGQAIDVTGLPDGRYRIEVTVDAQGLIEELDEGNNVAATDFELRSREGLPPEVIPLGNG